MTSRKPIALATGLALALGAGCLLDPIEPDVGPVLAGTCDPSDSDPDVEISFSLDIRPLMNRPRGEAGCSCHTPTNGNPSGIALGGLNLGSYQSLRQGGRVSGSELVVEGDPCASVIMEKVSDTPSFGARMPLDGPPYLSHDEIQLLHDWIAEGARDN
jgi:hypothetical protein